jgi:predicted PurR-regulated permease PerM
VHHPQERWEVVERDRVYKIDHCTGCRQMRLPADGGHIMSSQSVDEPAAADSGAPAPGPVLFPRLSAEDYRAGVYRYLYIFMRLIFVAVVALALWWIGSSLGALFVPLLASLVLAYLLDPSIKMLERRGFGRRVAIVLCLLGVVALLAVAILFLVPPLVAQIGALISQIPELVDRAINEWIPWLEARLRAELPESGRQMLRDNIQDVSAELPAMLERVGRWTVGAVSSTGYVLLTFATLVLVPLFTFYFLQHMHPLKVEVIRWIPQPRREYTLDVLRRMDVAVGHWFRGQIQVAAVIGLLFSVGLSITFAWGGIDPRLGLAIGIVSGVLNVVPYVGSIVAIVLTTLVVLLQWPGIAVVLGIVAVFVIINLLESYVVVPRIIGFKVGLSPIAVIILLLVGGELAGIWGILLIMPVAGAIKVIWPDLRAIYQETALYHGGVRASAGEADDDAQ